MKFPKFLQFIIHAEDGGYWAEAVGYSIYTQGKTLDEIIHNIREATDCHFFDEKKISLEIPILANVEVPQLA